VATKKDKAIKAANRFLQRGQIDKAIQQYERLVSEHDRDPRLRHKYGELLARKNQVSEALEEFRWVANFYEQGGFYTKALAVYKQMLDLDAERIDVHLHLGEIYLSQGKSSDAGKHFASVATKVEKEGSLPEKISVYERLIRVNPDDLDSLMRLVALYVDGSNTGKAIETLETLADTMRASGDPEQLLSILDRLCGITDENAAYKLEMASIHMDRGEARRAVTKLQDCFRIDPQDVQTLTLLGKAFRELEQTDKALQVYTELARILGARGDLSAQTEVEQTLREMVAASSGGDTNVAPISSPLDEIDLNQIVPEEALRYVVRGETYLKYNLTKRANDAAKTAAKRWPNLFVVLRLQASLREKMGEHEAASAAVLQAYGVCMDARELLAARACLVETTRLQPNDPSTRDRLVAFDDAMGDEIKTLEAGRSGSGETSIAVEEMDSLYGGGGRTHLRDEIDVEIDEVFTRPGSADPASTDDHLQALDENSLEFLSYENYLAEVASGTIDASLDGESVEGDREFEIEEPSTGEGPALEASEESLVGEENTEDFESLLAEMASAIENELDEDDESTEDTEGNARGSVASGAPVPANALELVQGYLEVGLFDEALRECSKALESKVEPAQTLLYMGRCHREMGNFDDAVERLMEGADAAADDAALALELHFELGIVYEAKGEGWMAYEVLGEVAQRDPSFRTDEVTSRLEAIASQLGVGEG
jgi:tetratricopeptide (TPR) repeat protein